MIFILKSCSELIRLFLGCRSVHTLGVLGYCIAQ
jgi:hypothetical protein